mgnify:CR=1 FL=1
MTERIMETLLAGDPRAGKVLALGYDTHELGQIERLYDIKVQGQLKSFLYEMGKSDGGVIGEYLIPLYTPSWGIRSHLLFQVDFFDQMQEAGHYTFLNKPFVVALVSETQYYFVQTGLGNDAVYHFDSNTDEVKETNWDLIGFLGELAEENAGDCHLVTEGSLVRI